MAIGAAAQILPNDMLIDGYVLDVNGQAVANHEVCVSYVSNTPSLPSDTLCTTTNANGYFTLYIQNGSLTGPNVSFDVSTYDPCALLPVVQTVDNAQGTVNSATLTFAICATGSGNCDVSMTASNDSTLGANGVWTFTATPTGTAPFTYDWWVDGASYSTQTVSHTFNGGIVGVYVTVTDANGCDAFVGDTLYLDGNQIGCDVQISFDQNPILGGGFLTANAVGVAPFTYLWNTGENTETIFPAEPLEGTYCVTITDASGCVSDACYTFAPNQGCSVDITTTIDSTGGGIFYTLTASAGFTDYVWSNGATTQSIVVSQISPNGEVHCVTATDNSGCTATACDTLFPNSGGNCFADFWYLADATGSLVVEDTVEVLYAGSFGNANTYAWTVTFNNFVWTASSQDLILPVPPTLVPVGGAMVEICVTVTDAVTGCTDTHCENVYLVQGNGNGNCDAEFSWMESSIVGAPLPAVEFTDQSSDAAYWFWDFGDGATSTEQNPLHLYQSAGTYFVCLTIVNADQSCQQTVCDTIIVGNPNNGGCNAAFNSSGPTPIGYTFTAQVQNQNLDYIWSVDNQAASGNGYELYVPGLTNGVHTICLTVIDSTNLCSDTECMTITVGSPNCYGYISGQLYAGSNNQPLDEGVVYLITHDAQTGLLTAVDSMVVDSGNYYFFGPVACGDYLIKAAAYPGSQYYNNHIPTYYGNSPFWAFAQTISIGQANIQVTSDVTLIAASNPGGPGFIGGLVSEGANKTDPGDPVSGMQVNLFDLNGNAIAYTYTNADGEFGFENLAYGTYQVYVEQLGVQTIPAIVTIGPDVSEVDDVQIWASETLITTGINEFDFEGAISGVYPNPVADNAAINFNLEAEVMVNINVVDLAGRTISTTTTSVANGENTLRISTDDLNEGYYFLNIQDVDGAFSVTRKFMRVD